MKKILEKSIRFGLSLTLLAPLVVSMQTMYPLHMGKVLFFQIIVEILLVLWAVQYLWHDKTLVKPRWFDGIVLGSFVAMLIATIVGVDPARSWWGYQSRLQGVFTQFHFFAFYALLRQFVRVERDWKRVWQGALGVGVVSALLAWILPRLGAVQYVGGHNSGLIGNPIFFAAYCIPLVFMAVAWCITATHRKEKWLMAGVGVVLLVALLVTGVRGAFIGLVGGLLTVAFLSIFLGSQRRIKMVVGGGVVALLIVGGGLYIFNRTSPWLHDTLPVVSRLLDISPKVTTATTRLMAWQIALQGFKDRPVFGWGPENFQYVFDAHYNPKFLEFGFAETVWDKPHSVPLEALVTTGAVGFLGYVAVLGVALFCLVKLVWSVRGERMQWYYVWMLGAVVAFVGQSLFSLQTMTSSYIWMLLVAGIAFHYSRLTSRDTVVPDRSAFFVAAGFASVALISFIFLRVNFVWYSASAEFSKARDLAQAGRVVQWKDAMVRALSYPVQFEWEQGVFAAQDLVDLDKRGLLTKEVSAAVAPVIAEKLEASRTRLPRSYEVRFYLAQVYGVEASVNEKPEMFGTSEAVLKEAEAIAPRRQQVLLLRAKNLLLQNKPGDAIKVLEELVGRDPSLVEPNWFLGLAYVANGEEKKALPYLAAGQTFAYSSENRMLYLIDVYARQKEYRRIVPLYEELIHQKPGNALWYARLGAVYAELGDSDKVVEYLRKAVDRDASLYNEAIQFLKKRSITTTNF